jgi:putative oxygen-independent coproporphyrinogen III oxidase
MSLATVTLNTGVRLAALPPLGLYVHMPWCVRKCPYCDFNSHEMGKGVIRIPIAAPGQGQSAPAVLPEEAEKEYVQALIQDLEAALPQIWGRRVHTIFFGGGTPSLFSAASMDTLLSAFRARLVLSPECEITMEANPGTFEAQKFRDYRQAGVNRLSIGIQSFNPRHLKALGRIHDADEARRAIDIAQASFDNVNLDLMFALPEQTLEEARADVTAALAAGTTHLSFYHLTLEPNTVFYRYPPAIPDHDAAAEIHDLVIATVTGAGYAHYETSAYARPGRESKHNLNYWRFGDYLGIGAGAHSKISFPDRIIRNMRAKQPREYLRRVNEGIAVQEQNEVTRPDLPFEFMMNALRLTDGFVVSSFQERTGLPISAAEKPLAEAERRGLIERTHERIKPTGLGQRFLNDLLELFLVEPELAR